MNRIPFEPEHLVTLESVEKILGYDYGDRYARALLLKGSGPCVTITIGEEVVACGGIRTILPGTGEAWGALSMKCRGPSALRFIRDTFDEMAADYTRVQAYTKSGWIEGEKSLEFLGFHLEAILHKFGPNGIDQALYARIK